MDRILEESKQSVTCPICADVFDDPKTLTCSHTFCLHCLIEFRGFEDGHRNKFCPVCRELTVPPVEQIQTLPSNEFASKVSKLIKENERPAVDPRTQPAVIVAENVTPGDEMYSGALIEEDENERGKSNVGMNIGASVLAGTAVTLATGGLFGVIAGLAVFGFGAASSAEIEKRRKQSYKCDGCGAVKYSLTRYRCGICDNFILCPSCFENTGNVSRVHNSQHFFLKLKFQQKRHVPPGPVLKPKIDEMVQTIDYQSSKHGRAYVHSPQRLIIIPAIQCKFCGTMPITGFRYKCGMCNNYDLCADCERTSEQIHDKKHVFIVMRHHSEINITSEPLLTAHFY